MVKIEGTSPFMQGDPRDRAGAIQAQKEHDMESIFGKNKVKTIQREVNGVKQEIIVGTNKNNEKVRYVADENGHLQELVATDTNGKNKYVTVNDMEAQILQMTGMTRAELQKQGIFAQYKHGSLVFMDNTGAAAGKMLADAMRKHDEEAAIAEAVKKANIGIVATPELGKMPEISLINVGTVPPQIKKEEENKDVAQNTVKPQGAGKASHVRAPKKMQGNTATAPTAQVKKAIVDRQPAYLTEAEAKKRGLGAVDNHGTFLLNGGNEVKPQGNDKGGIQQDTIYYATKVGNKTIYIKSSVSDKKKAAIIKAEEDRQKANETKYNTNFTTGKTFAQKLSANSGRGILEIKDADLKEATKDLTPQYFKGFLKGMQSQRSINGSRSQFMNGVYYSKAASPQAKKDFALKMLSSAKGWNSKATCEINGKKYTYDSLIKEIKANGLTEETAKAAGMLFNQIKLA